MMGNPLVDLALVLASRRQCSPTHFTQFGFQFVQCTESNGLWRRLTKEEWQARVYALWGSSHHWLISSVSSPSCLDWNEAHWYLHTKYLLFLQAPHEILLPLPSVISNWPSTCTLLIMVFVFCAGLHTVLFNFAHGCLSLTQISK